MNYLDQLESESIYILREAFNKIDKLAMLWSIGKDSNVMLWCARKAFFGFVPFPLVNIDTGKKFPEVYEFRDRVIAEWKLDCIVGTCPPVEEMDPSLPPAARSAARKTAGLNIMLARQGFSGLIAGIRRDEEEPAPKSGCSARAGSTIPGISATSRRSSGTSSTPSSRRERTSASIHYCTGRNSTSGATRNVKTSP